MSRGLGSWLKGGKERAAPNRRIAPAPAEPVPAGASDEGDLHFCCICGAVLGFDREDEINGEGWGRDICGDCNRTRNFDIELGM
jgi:hypothetical protein